MIGLNIDFRTNLGTNFIYRSTQNVTIMPGVLSQEGGEDIVKDSSDSLFIDRRFTGSLSTVS